MKIITTIAILFIGLFSTQLFSQVEVSTGVDLFSKFVDRSENIVDGAVAQPAIDFSFGESGVSFNMFGSFALANRELFRYSDELDLTLGYSSSFNENVEYSAGLIYYLFPTNDSKFRLKDHTTTELFTTISLQKVALQPTLTFFYDFQLNDDLFAFFETSKEINISQHAFTLGSGIGYWESIGGITNVDFSVESELSVGSATLVPKVVYSIMTNNAISEYSEVFFVLGLGL